MPSTIAPLHRHAIVTKSGRLLALSSLLATLAAPAQRATAETPTPAQRLDQAHAQLIRARDTANPQLCHDLRADFERHPPQAWSHMAFMVWHGLGGCDAQTGGAWTRVTPSAEDIRQAWQLPFSHFDRMPVDLRLKNDLTVDMRVQYWSMLRSFQSPTLAAVADAEEAAQLDDWHRRAAQTPPDPLAVASLTRLGAAVYGMRWLAAWMQVQQQRLEATLGPGHAATLHMLRSRIFAARAHERPAEALALSDDHAARVARHHPQDERLAMLNRSERIGALAAVGRAADALDEGRLLLAWLQKREPPDPGNVMRTAYNLAGVALEMGDADAAEAFARLSIEQGSRSNNHDRTETTVAQWLLHQAQVLRGDEGAGPALEALLRDPARLWDLPTLDPLHTLLQWARRSGHADTERWAAGMIDQVVHSQSTALHAARALPLVLRADGASPGSADGLGTAAVALVHGLAADGGVAEVRPALALARHVAPLQPAGAAWLCKRAAQALIVWRQGLPELPAGQPRAWLTEHDEGLRHCIGLLIDLGRLGEAEQMLAVLREEELHEFRRRSRGPVAAVAVAPALGLTPDERRRNDQLMPLQTRLQREAAAARARADAHPDQRQRRGGVDPTAEAVAQDASSALQAISLQPPPSAAVSRPAEKPVVRLPPGHARITYVLAARSGGEVSALVDTGRQRRRVVLPVTPTDLGRAVADLRAEVSRPDGAGVPAAARRLHDALVRPLAPALRGVRHLSILPDGVLRYLPFAALHDGQRYLVERYSLSLQLAPDRAAPVAAAPRLPATRVAAFGRSLPSATHSPLPGVVDELASLRRLPGVQVQLALDRDFTRAGLVAALEQRPQVVHLASHFVLTPTSEEDSYLLLGDGAPLSLRELRQLPWQGVQLALLSACESALPLGPDGAGQGREWAGFAAALQRAGVRDVLATLWRVDDAGTARWMAAFYEQWARRGSTDAVSPDLLGRSQREWLRRHRDTELAHPRHWAGFVWIGSS
jgi:CHAT domain-containing protein